VQLARAGAAALAALMITFSPDHSAAFGVSVFSGFAIVTALIHLFAVGVVFPRGRRTPSILLGTAALIAGLAGGIALTRTITGFFVMVVAWAVFSGIVETVAGARALRTPKAIGPGDIHPWSDGTEAPPPPRSESRDALVVGILTLVLGVALLLVPTGFALDYTIDDVDQTFTLTGIIIGVGIFGGYAAILAVYLGIAGFSPRATQPTTTEAPAEAQQKDPV
jgi:uncharacterized membrane protein HdeD (DUF308 family)